ncbi:MAG TPA: hypothetical protein VFF40_01280 [Acidimicrobiia bacterium]|nr:hypothetical protein [Acidimicrobiia bacterium]
MLAWYIGMSVLGVFMVFRSVGIDYRLVALGAIMPLVLDAPFGRPAYAHTLAFSVVLLGAAMLGTIGRSRMSRRRLLCLPIGTFCALVLSGAWTQTEVLWWPTLGWSFPPGSLLAVWWVVLIEELVGLVAIWWIVGLCDLYLSGPRRELLHTGRLHSTSAPEVGR